MRIVFNMEMQQVWIYIGPYPMPGLQWHNPTGLLKISLCSFITRICYFYYLPGLSDHRRRVRTRESIDSQATAALRVDRGIPHAVGNENSLPSSPWDQVQSTWGDPRSLLKETEISHPLRISGGLPSPRAHSYCACSQLAGAAILGHLHRVRRDNSWNLQCCWNWTSW